MSMFLYVLFEVCGLYVWAWTSGASYNLHFNTPLCCYAQAACFCSIFPTLDDRSLASPLTICVKGTIFTRYASVGEECRKCGGIAKIGSRGAGGEGGICCRHSILLGLKGGRTATACRVCTHEVKHRIFTCTQSQKKMHLCSHTLWLTPLPLLPPSPCPLDYL